MHAQLFFGNTVSTVTTNKWNPCPRLVSSSVFSCGPCGWRGAGARALRGTLATRCDARQVRFAAIRVLTGKQDILLLPCR